MRGGLKEGDKFVAGSVHVRMPKVHTKKENPSEMKKENPSETATEKK